MSTSASPSDGSSRRSRGHGWVWLTALVAVAAAGALVLAPRPRVPPPVLYPLPEFTFTRQDGQPFGSQQLRGRVWVANFIFTRCPTVCPAFTRKMAGIQHRTEKLGAAVHLVSFSVDPDYDTPEVLTAYAQTHRADLRSWSFLTGRQQAMQQTVVSGFKQSMQQTGQRDDVNGGILHGTHFVLVDRDLQIRGFYSSNDDEAVARLLQDLETL
ncbi:MAG: SCO family protein [Myxococcaceae bacterium]